MLPGLPVRYIIVKGALARTSNCCMIDFDCFLGLLRMPLTIEKEFLIANKVALLVHSRNCCICQGLCGDDKPSSSFSKSKVGMGPLLISSHFIC